jgi:ABC-type transport system involved in multi-copper enzyme maturation permease subunit
LLNSPWTYGPLGIWLLGWLFIVVLGVLRGLLLPRWQPLAVARTVLDEAIRMKVALVFILLLLFAIPVLPFLLDVEQPLRYRIQQFLSYSLTSVTALLSLMTIFLACGTLTSEVRDRQIFLVAVKPINRGMYLIGKWLGIVLLNAALLVVMAGAIYGFTQFYLATLSPQDAWDELAVEEEVLTARVAVQPQPLEPFAEQIEEQIEQELQNNPERLVELGREAAMQRGLIEPDRELLLELGVRHQRQLLAQRIETQWRSMAPHGTPGNESTFVFTGLQTAGESARSIQLRYMVESRAVAGTEIPLRVYVNGRQLRDVLNATVDITQRLPLPAEVVDSQGRLVLRMVNLDPRRSILFEPDDLEMLYRRSGFGANFGRAVAIIWLKLAFLAALGLAAATFLGFPVAVLVSLVIFAAAAASDFLLEAVGAFGINNTRTATIIVYVQQVLKVIGWSVTHLLSQFSEFRPTSSIVDGRYISWSTVGRCVLWIGVVWTGLVALVAWLIFRRRELAHVQV